MLGTHIKLCVDSQIFLKNFHWSKMTENDQKLPKNRVCGLLRNIKPLLLPGIGVKQKILWSTDIL